MFSHLTAHSNMGVNKFERLVDKFSNGYPKVRFVATPVVCPKWQPQECFAPRLPPVPTPHPSHILTCNSPRLSRNTHSWPSSGTRIEVLASSPADESNISKRVAHTKLPSERETFRSESL